MIKLDCYKKKPQVALFDLLDESYSSVTSKQKYNELLSRNDIEVISETKPSYVPPPMFPTDDLSRARMLVIITYRKKGK